MLHILDHQNTLLNRFIAELRDVHIQTDSMRFRRNLERVGEIMAYEISKTLDYAPRMVETPLGEALVQLPHDDIVVATILRAGIPYHQGFLNYFDYAQSAFVSSYRKYGKDNSFHINVEYVSTCELSDKVLILVDPMLATGSSLVYAYQALIEKGGRPSHTHLATVIASEEGIEHIRKHFPAASTTLWCGSVDQELTVKSYIVPGIGDTGDLAYGAKI